MENHPAGRGGGRGYSPPVQGGEGGVPPPLSRLKIKLHTIVEKKMPRASSVNDPIMHAYNTLRALEVKLEKVSSNLKNEVSAHALTIDDMESDRGYIFFKESIDKAEVTYNKRLKEVEEAYQNTVAYYEREIEKLKEKFSNSVPKTKRYRLLLSEEQGLKSEIAIMRKNIQEAQVAEDARRIERMKREAAEREYKEAREAEMARQNALQVLEQQKAIRDAADMERWKKQWAEEAKAAGGVPPPSPPAAPVKPAAPAARKNRFLSMTLDEYEAIDDTTLSEQDLDDNCNAYDEKFCALAKERDEKYMNMSFKELVAIDVSCVSEKEANSVAKALKVKDAPKRMGKQVGVRCA